MTTTKVQDAEVTICGLTFIVDFNYTQGDTGDYFNPISRDEIEIIAVSVKGQPEADADSLLTMIKEPMFTPGKFYDGYDLLEAEILNNSEKYI